MNEVRDSRIVRGSVWWATLVPEKANPHKMMGTRPVVVISNDTCNKRSPMVLVCPMSTKADNHHSIHPTVTSCTSEISYVLTEQVTPLDKHQLGDYIGKLSVPEECALNAALKISMGLESKHIDNRPSSIEFESPRSATNSYTHNPAPPSQGEIDQDILELGSCLKRIFLSAVSSSLTPAVSAEGRTKAASSADSMKRRSGPPKRKWTADRIESFMQDYPSLNRDELLIKYELNSIATARTYYGRMKSGKIHG